MAKTMEVLRRIFHRIETGDRVELDGDEEPSGRVGFTLFGPDGEAKTCGITPAGVTLEPGVCPREELCDLARDAVKLIGKGGAVSLDDLKGEELTKAAGEFRLEVEGGGWTEGETVGDEVLSRAVRCTDVILAEVRLFGKLDSAYMACMIAAYMQGAVDAKGSDS